MSPNANHTIDSKSKQGLLDRPLVVGLVSMIILLFSLFFILIPTREQQTEIEEEVEDLDQLLDLVEELTEDDPH